MRAVQPDEITDDEPEEIAWSYDETASRLGITRQHLGNLIKRGEGPPSVQLGRRRLFIPATIKEWLRQREARATA